MENKEALDRFCQLKKEIENQLEWLQEANDEFYSTVPDEVNWANVGDLQSLAQTLQEAINKVKGEG